MFSGDFQSGTKASYLEHLPKPKGRLWHPLQRVFEDLGLNISSLTRPQKGPIPGSSRGHYQQVHVPEVIYKNCRPVARLKQLGGGGGGQANWLNKATPTPPHSRQSKNRQEKKGVDLLRKTIPLHLHHTFWYISLPSLYADYHVKLPNFTFEGGRKKTTTNFAFSFTVTLVIGQ